LSLFFLEKLGEIDANQTDNDFGTEVDKTSEKERGREGRERRESGKGWAQ
jgi:hypothetical protein